MDTLRQDFFEAIYLCSKDFGPLSRKQTRKSRL
jgi:hypothetical protein